MEPLGKSNSDATQQLLETICGSDYSAPMIENFIGNYEGYLHGSVAVALLGAYIGGVLIGFTPCVYPVVPIIVGFIGARSSDSKIRGFILSLIYVCGMAMAYTVLGAIAALSGTLFGQIQANPWIYFLAGNLCLFMGFSMMGLFRVNVAMPGFIMKYQKLSRGGILGSFLLGATSGMLIGPCTAPVLAVLLVFVATKQNVAFGMILLFVYAFGMGTLMIAMGTFASILRNLPKSGVWMVAIQKIFGWILVGAGEYYLIISGQLFL